MTAASLLAAIRRRGVRSATALGIKPALKPERHLPPFLLPNSSSAFVLLHRAMTEPRVAYPDAVKAEGMLRTVRAMPVVNDGYVVVGLEDGDPTVMVHRLTPVGRACHAALVAGYAWSTARGEVDCAQTDAFWRERLNHALPRIDFQRIAGFAEPELQPLVRDALHLFLQR